MTKFTDLGLAEPILRAVLAEGYTIPTPIQAKVIPIMLAGRDIVGIAQTGTGKTAAFVLPLLHNHSQMHGRPGPKACHALILAPTRELAAQIAENIRGYGQFIQHSVVVVVGGVRPAQQIKALSQGVDIVVATPGRLEDHIANGKFRLDKTKTIILDEADQMLDLGFMPAIRRLMAKVPKPRQTLLLSATMPKQIRQLAGDFLDRPVEISVAPQSRPIERITQQVYFSEKPGKRALLASLLSAPDVQHAIVFTKTKHGANKVVQNLEKAGIAASAIHGNKSQRQREHTLGAFRAGTINVLVATDIAARGIDVDDISHVINYELPNIAESYVHRIGRTARAGKSGVAISLCDGAERKFLFQIEKLTGIKLQRMNVGDTPSTKDDTPDERLHEPPKHKRPPKKKKHKQRSNRPSDKGKPKPKPVGAETTNKPAKPKPNRKRRPRRSTSNTG
ncbi:MAG: DEAD/DEAH box helicase [Robiginitomaculum sp.]|nr:DEAD/DEAH box helicase [Robiginitomaculum sp.]